MQLKAIIKNLAKEKHISAQPVMPNVMLKGVFLIAAMVGFGARATLTDSITYFFLTNRIENLYEKICQRLSDSTGRG